MLQETALQCALCTSCFCMHCDFSSLACSRLRPCYVLCAPLASACIASLRRLHAAGYGLAMCFMHLLHYNSFFLRQHALRLCVACMLQATALICDYAPLASACIAYLCRLHAPGYGLAMCFVHLLHYNSFFLRPHALRLCVACMRQATALICDLCTTCLRMHSVFTPLACSRLRPCNVLCAPLASACIASLRRLHAPGYGLAMCFLHLLLPHALRLCVACMLQAMALLCALCTSCLRMHSVFTPPACSRLRPCNVLCAPLASAGIASLRRLHALGYGLAMC